MADDACGNGDVDAGEDRGWRDGGSRGGAVDGGKGAVGSVVLGASEGEETGDDGGVLADSESDLCVWGVVYSGPVDHVGELAIAAGGDGPGANAGGSGAKRRASAARGVRGRIRAV